MKTILVSGAAGFIGSNVARQLLSKGFSVVGIDNLNDYYSPLLKEFRLEQLRKYPNFIFIKVDIEDFNSLKRKLKNFSFDAIINLSARAGVRHSLVDPFVYERTNSLGTLHLLEFAKENNIPKLVMASTSSLYAGQTLPFSEDLPVNTPISPYAASKKAAEAMAYTYHFLYGIDVTILRYFTVYGPAGRPDMSYFIFSKKILNGEEIPVYGDGSQSRDFTYIDDITEGTVKSLKMVGYEIINLGNDNPHKLMDMIKLLETYLGKKAKIKYLPFHQADMPATWADIRKAKSVLNWEPQISLEDGIKKLVEWIIKNQKFFQTIPLVL